MYGLSEKATNCILQLIKQALPHGKVIWNLGLNYEKIHAYENDCMLFWKKDSNVKHCFVCSALRWKSIHDKIL